MKRSLGWFAVWLRPGRGGASRGRLCGRRTRRNGGAEGVREAGRARRVLRVPLRRPLRPGLRVRHALVPPHHHDPGVHARARASATATTRKRRRCSAASPGATRTIRASPRPTATTTAAGCSSTTCRNARIARIDLKDFKTTPDLRADPEPLGRARLPVPDAEHRVRVRRVALLGAGAEPPGARSRTTRRTSTASSPGIKVDPKNGTCRSASRS